jgi:hypothetical protein
MSIYLFRNHSINSVQLMRIYSFIYPFKTAILVIFRKNTLPHQRMFSSSLKALVQWSVPAPECPSFSWSSKISSPSCFFIKTACFRILVLVLYLDVQPIVSCNLTFSKFKIFVIIFFYNLETAIHFLSSFFI